MVPKIRIETVCATDLAPRVVEAIQSSAHTGAIGDGKIFVLDVGQAVRIRTGTREMPEPVGTDIFDHVYAETTPELAQQRAGFVEYHASFEEA